LLPGCASPLHRVSTPRHVLHRVGRHLTPSIPRAVPCHLSTSEAGRLTHPRLCSSTIKVVAPLPSPRHRAALFFFEAGRRCSHPLCLPYAQVSAEHHCSRSSTPPPHLRSAEPTTPVSLRLHHRVLGLSLPHSLHSHVGHRHRHYGLPEARRFTAARLPRRCLHRLDVAGEDFPLVLCHCLTICMPESRCHEGHHRPRSRASATLHHGLRVRANAARERAQRAGRGMCCRSVGPHRCPMQLGRQWAMNDTV
jgi:hypothetical protein